MGLLFVNSPHFAAAGNEEDPDFGVMDAGRPNSRLSIPITAVKPGKPATIS